MAIEPGTVQLNDVLIWKGCPLKDFDVARVLGISPNGEFVKLSFIYHPVRLSQCDWCVDIDAAKLFRHYKPIRENRWNTTSDSAYIGNLRQTA